MPVANAGLKAGWTLRGAGGAELRDTAQRKFGQLCFL
jgi:hypothetical protein